MLRRWLGRYGQSLRTKSKEFLAGRAKTGKGLDELQQKQTAELSAVNDELGEDSVQIVYYYTTISTLPVVLSFQAIVCVSAMNNPS